MSFSSLPARGGRCSGGRAVGGRRRARSPAACVQKGGRERGSDRMPTPRGEQRPQKGLLFIFVDSWGKVLNIFSMLQNNKFPPLFYPLIAGLMGRSSLSSSSSSLPPAADGAAADGRRTAGDAHFDPRPADKKGEGSVEAAGCQRRGGTGRTSSSGTSSSHLK